MNWPGRTVLQSREEQVLHDVLREELAGLPAASPRETKQALREAVARRGVKLTPEAPTPIGRCAREPGRPDRGADHHPADDALPDPPGAAARDQAQAARKGQSGDRSAADGRADRDAFALRGPRHHQSVQRDGLDPAGTVPALAVELPPLADRLGGAAHHHPRQAVAGEDDPLRALDLPRRQEAPLFRERI